MDRPQLPSNARGHVRQRSHWNLAMLALGSDSVTFRDWTMRRKCLMFITSKPNGVTHMLHLVIAFYAVLIGLALQASVLGSLTHRKVGGIHFLKLGRLNLSLSRSRS